MPSMLATYPFSELYDYTMFDVRARQESCSQTVTIVNSLKCGLELHDATATFNQAANLERQLLAGIGLYA